MTNPHPYPQWLAREERKVDRSTLHLSGTASGAKTVQQSVEMVDLSPLGCRLRVAEPLTVGSYVTLASAASPRLEGWVAWSRKAECGIDFAHPVPDVVIEQIAAGSPR